MIFESLPTTPRSSELIDKAFSRAARSGRAKSGLKAQQSMLQTASSILSDNLENVVTQWPDFESVDPFYYELADAIVDVDALRQSLSRVTWTSRQIGTLRREYQSKVRKTEPKQHVNIESKLSPGWQISLKMLQTILIRLGQLVMN